MLRAIRDHKAANSSQITFSSGDLVVYLPQRPSTHGLGYGRIGGNEGYFRLDVAEVLNSSAAEAPPADPLPTSDAPQLEAAAAEIQTWLPPNSSGNVSHCVSVVLNEPESCRLARMISFWVMALIIISTLAFMLETLPEFHVDGGPELRSPALWDNLETFIVLQFSLEYVLRLATCQRALPFVVDPMNAIDLAAIAPWYLELIGLSGDDSAVLRVFRLARVIRIFKLGKYAAGLQLFGRTLLSSLDALVLLFFFLAIATILASSIMYFVERGSWSVSQQEWVTEGGDASQFTSIPATFWWCVVTLTTVGYGDVVPITLQGRLVAVLTMLAGVLTIALPVSILGSNFQMEYEKLDKEKKVKEAQLSAARSTSPKQLVSPLQQELGKLGELLNEMDSLTRVAQEKQAALLRIANSPLFHEHA